MITQPVSVDYFRDIGEGWAHAIETKSCERLADFCRPDVRSRIMTPNHYAALESAGALVVKLRQWFVESDPIEIQQVRLELVGDKLAISYRLKLREQGEWLEVEQQIFGMLKDGLFTQLDLLCSGFRPLSPSAPTAQPGPGGFATHLSGLVADAVLVATDEVHGSTCATLTPAIKAKLRELDSGQVLMVQVRDSTARGDIEAWCRLSGNELLTAVEDEEGKLSCFLRKK